MSILDEHFDKWTPEPNTGCYIWTGAVRGGDNKRPVVSITTAKMTSSRVTVPRLVCEETYGPPLTPDHQALHNTQNGCVGGICVNPDHLRWGTPSENQWDVPLEVRQRRVRGLRHEAKEAGRETYFTGKPCKNGHVALRRVVNGHCVECVAMWNANRYR